jgi:hypothetical protein
VATSSSRMIATLLLLFAAISAYATFGSPKTPLNHCVRPNGSGGLLNTTLPRCTEGQVSVLQPSSRVAVVGGGPAGVSMAKLLHDRGIKAHLAPHCVLSVLRASRAWVDSGGGGVACRTSCFTRAKGAWGVRRRLSVWAAAAMTWARAVWVASSTAWSTFSAVCTWTP